MFNTYEDIAKYLGTLEVSLDEMKVPMKQAKREYLIPFLGREVVNAIGGSVDDDLVDLYKEAFAHFTMLKLAPRIEARVTSNGIVRAGGGESSSPGAYKNQVDKLLTEYENAGYGALDDLVAYMVEEDFEEWLDSSNYLESKGLIIPSGEVFTKHYKLKHPYLIYEHLKQSIRYVQNLILAKEFGDDVFGDLLSFNESVDANKLEVYGKLQQSVAYLTVAEALHEMRIKITSEGVSLMGNSSGSEYNKVKKSPETGDLEMLKTSLKAKGLAYLQDAKARLLQIPAYAPAESKPIEINQMKSGVFSL